MNTHKVSIAKEDCSNKLPVQKQQNIRRTQLRPAHSSASSNSWEARSQRTKLYFRPTRCASSAIPATRAFPGFCSAKGILKTQTTLTNIGPIKERKEVSRRMQWLGSEGVHDLLLHIQHSNKRQEMDVNLSQYSLLFSRVYNHTSCRFVNLCLAVLFRRAIVRRFGHDDGGRDTRSERDAASDTLRGRFLK